MADGLDSRSLVPRIVDLLRDRIIRGELQPGSKVRQDEFAEALGVSRTPLREAFRLLEAGGWLISRPRAGVEVARFSVAEVTEIAVMRLLIEPLAARSTARRHTSEEEQALHALLATTKTTPAGISRSDHVDMVTRDFHFGIYGVPATQDDHKPLHHEIKLYWARYARYRRVYWDVDEQVQHSEDEHHAILDAWCSGDADAVERLVARHLFDALLALMRTLEPGADLSVELQELAARYGIPVGADGVRPPRGAPDLAPT